MYVQELADPVSEARQALDVVECMLDDVSRALRLPFVTFWSHVLYDPSLLTVDNNPPLPFTSSLKPDSLSVNNNRRFSHYLFVFFFLFLVSSLPPTCSTLRDHTSIRTLLMFTPPLRLLRIVITHPQSWPRCSSS